MKQQELHGIMREMALADQITGEDQMERIPDPEADEDVDAFIAMYPHDPVVQELKNTMLRVSRRKIEQRQDISTACQLRDYIKVFWHTRAAAEKYTMPPTHRLPEVDYRQSA